MLNLIQLEKDLEGAYKAISNKDIDPKKGREILAKAVALAIDKYIKTGVVNTTVATPSGPGTGIGNIT